VTGQIGEKVWSSHWGMWTSMAAVGRGSILLGTRRRVVEGSRLPEGL